MPELPEVEAWRRALDEWLVGRQLAGVVLHDPAAVRARLSTRPADGWDEARGWAQRLAGRRVLGTSRAGKRLGVHLEGQWVLVHLGMTGRFVRGRVQPKAARVELRVVGGEGVDEEATVWFCDVRRFGCWVPLADGSALADDLGPDALLAPLDGPALGRCLRGRRAVKVALLDQARLAGLGNIHAAEALWRAAIAPTTACADLTEAQLGRLAVAIHQQLHEAVEQIGGVDDFVYVTDGGDNPFVVYGREGEPCARCGGPVQRFVQSGRATFWCAGCQHA